MSSFKLDFDALKHDAARAEEGILDGRILKASLLEQLAHAVEVLRKRDVRPRLDVIQVGDDPASTVYVRNKIRSCNKIGVESVKHELPVETTRDQLHDLLDELNADARVHGILVQLPLPDHLDPHDAIEFIDSHKDVDGFHPHNLGNLMAWRGALEPCTPRGVMTMFGAYDVPLRGERAVVVGRSMTVGRPMAQMLMRADATVTVCHRHTRDLAEHVGAADVLVVATGVPELIRGEWIKPGAVVIDVGISRREDGSLCGDVEFEAARERARLITPVPGGVGQMTVATLMENTVRAACERHEISIDLTRK